MPWSFQADTPIYTQLVARLQEQIVSGAYPPGSKLPSVRDLAADAGVNPNTVQRAFAELERLGLIYTQRTSGKFVTKTPPRLTRRAAPWPRGRRGSISRPCRPSALTVPRSSHF